MIEFSGFTEKANSALNSSIKTASSLGHTYVGSEHILCGLLSDESGVAGHILQKQGINREGVISKLRQSVGSGIPTNLGVSDFTPRSKRILEKALTEARKENSSFVGTKDILYRGKPQRLLRRKKRRPYAVYQTPLRFRRTYEQVRP